MKNEKELSTVIKDKHEIKLCEENKLLKNTSASVLELSITKCPIACNNCKTDYSNKLTGITLVCKCRYHH